MAPRIGRKERPGPALWRLLREDLDGARADLAGDEPAEKRVHRARQRLKRARSLVRVLKPAIGPAARSLRHEIAAAARLLARARDADAAAAAARELTGAGDAEAGFERVAAALGRRAEEAHRTAAPVGEVAGRLAGIAARLGGLETRIDGRVLLDRAIAGTYRAGRRSMRRARSSLATPDLHGWRKEVKALSHLLRLGQKRLPKPVRGMAGDLDRLGELLGLDHDHAMLAERLALAPEPDPALMRQLAVIARERRALEAEAFRLGGRLYRRRPKRFARRAAVR